MKNVCESVGETCEEAGRKLEQTDVGVVEQRKRKTLARQNANFGLLKD